MRRAIRLRLRQARTPRPQHPEPVIDAEGIVALVFATEAGTGSAAQFRLEAAAVVRDIQELAGAARHAAAVPGCRRQAHREESSTGQVVGGEAMLPSLCGCGAVDRGESKRQQRRVSQNKKW